MQINSASEPSPEIPFAERLRHSYRKLVASFTYYSGQLEFLRKQSVLAGKASWRILRYSHIIEPEYSAFPLKKTQYVRPQTFEEHLRYLSRRCCPMHLDDVLELFAKGERIPDKAVCVTLDGGWEDQFRMAVPYLLKYRIPAIFFLPTAFIGTEHLLWRDKLLLAFQALKQSGKSIPPFFFLEAELKNEVERLCPEGTLTEAAIELIVDAIEQFEPKKRFAAYAQVGHALQELPDMPLERVFMTWDEVKQLSQSGFRFGSLGHRHQPFDEMTPEEIAADLHESARKLYQEGIHFSKLFAFPEGIVSQAAAQAIYKAGIKQSVAIGKIDPPRPKEGELAIFGRTAMFQDVSFAADIFACRVWDIKTWGCVF